MKKANKKKQKKTLFISEHLLGQRPSLNKRKIILNVQENFKY